MEHFYIFLVNFWDLYNYFTWVASSLANIMKKMVFTTGRLYTAFQAFPIELLMKVEGRAKKGGKGGERRFCFFPVLSLLLHPIFLLSFQLTTNKRGSACYVGYWYTTRPPFHCFGRPAIQPQRLMWKRLLAHFIQAFLCSVFFVFFNLHWITGKL